MVPGFHLKFTARDAKRLLCSLIVFEVCLILVFAVDVLFGTPTTIHLLFDVNGEATIPAWFSSIQLFLIGTVFLFTGRRRQRDLFVSARFLISVGVGFIFFSMDEAAGIHEKITGVLNDVEWVFRFKGDHGIWIPVYLAISGVFAVITHREISALCKYYPGVARLLALGAMILLLGGVGMEIVSYQFLHDRPESWLYKAATAMEEFLEMAGASIVLYGTILFALHREGLSASNDHGRMTGST